MLSCYRRDEAHSPEIYGAAVAAILGDYPRDVVDYITDPRTGLPSKQKFLPNVAEVREACDARAAAVERISTYEKRVSEQIRLTEEWKNYKVPESLKAKGKAWLDRTDPVSKQLSENIGVSRDRNRR